MIINLYKLCQNKETFEKYKDRQVKLFCKNRQAWIGEKDYAIKHEEAKVFTVALALPLSHIGSIEAHFLPDERIGNGHSTVKDFEGDEIYQMVGVNFDAYKHNKNK